MSAANRDQPKSDFLLHSYELSDSDDVTSRDTDQDYTPNSSPTKKIVATNFSQKTDSDGKTVATSMPHPRLSVNGKRIGRPPGTFKHLKTPMKKFPTPLDFARECKWDNCNFVCDNVEQISAHMSTKHYNSKDATCKWEGCTQKKFKSYYLLVRHCRGHTGERPNTCPIGDCPKAYKSKDLLTNHIRSHTGEKPFACQFENCTKSFGNASDRGKHENRCHSAKKLYACDVGSCKKSYTDPSSLRKHILQIHGPEELAIRRKTKASLEKSRRAAAAAVSPGAEVVQLEVLGAKVEPMEIPMELEELQALPQPVPQYIPQPVPQPMPQPVQQLVPQPVPQPVAMPQRIWNPLRNEGPENSAFDVFVPHVMRLCLTAADYMEIGMRENVAHCIAIRQESVRESYNHLCNPPAPTPIDKSRPLCRAGCSDCDECNRIKFVVRWGRQPYNYVGPDQV